MLKSNNIDGMDGPINFGERLNWWGLLIEGHDVDPNYKMPYTKPYYQKLFEDYGFQEGLLNVNMSIDELRRKMDLLFDVTTNKEIVNTLKENSKNLKQQTRKMWEEVLATLKA